MAKKRTTTPVPRKKTPGHDTPLVKPKVGAIAPPSSEQLLADLRQLILHARSRVAQAANSALVVLYWHVGNRIQTEILRDKRAAYGQEILSTVSKELAGEFGNGFSVPNLSRMVGFAQASPNLEIVVTLSQQLGWSHFVEILVGPFRGDHGF